MEIQLIGVLVVATVAFAAPLGLGFVSSPRLPSVVLEIVADVLIGPVVLGLVEIDAPLRILSLFMLALAGLEADLDRLRGRGCGVSGFAFSLALALGIALALGAADLVQPEVAGLYLTVVEDW